HEFLLCQREGIKRGLDWGLAEAPAALMGSSMIVLDRPRIEIGLQLVETAIDLFAERNPIELVQDGAMKAFADAVGLWALGLRAHIHGSGCRKTQCRDRSTCATTGCRVRRRTAPPGH